jgi:hypothetical protein
MLKFKLEKKNSKNILSQKKESWKLKYFTIPKKRKRKRKPSKNPLKRNQNPSRYYYNNSAN